jgi:cyclophilin family peptidyl-prolyl cis-trans isomerase
MQTEACMVLKGAAIALALGIGLLPAFTPQKSPGAGPVIVLETVRGTIELETYPDEAPKTVARVLELAKKNFYNGLRFHRAENLLIQVGDPTTRDMSRRSWWGRAGSGKPIGVSEITRKRRHVRGAVGMAHSGSPKEADSQFYILRRASPQLDGKYTVFGRVISGMEVVDKIQEADILRKVTVSH